ncbi:extracellular solute-binding protein [Streptomyces sp. SBST2-5]|uniref:Extracellular solute-binding protein n=1 Tax=Streptomyces composti TaxID=2720025 RepID=A0ABX1AIE5_9ACTN|nr:extracellular solute-binding protein [Streptomyces composti]NJP53654.1 extracellular solute-binding protein [Streptomyces composti]
MIRRSAGVLALLLLAACTGGADDGRAGPAATSAKDEQGVIIVASGRDVTGKNGVRQQLIDEWNARHRQSGFSARLVELPGSADEQRSQLLGALQSGSAAYDVVNLDVTWVPEFAAAGLIRPLPEKLVDDDVIPSVAQTAWWDGTVYAAPFNSDVGLLYYRHDYLKKARVRPAELGENTTWQDLRDIIDTLDSRLDDENDEGDENGGKGEKDAGDAKDGLNGQNGKGGGKNAKKTGYEKGWTTQLDAYEGRTVNAMEAFATAVPDLALVDEDGSYTGTVDGLTEGIAELRRRTDRPYTLKDAYESDEAASLGDFVEGRTAFLRHWPYVYPTLLRTFDDGQLRVAPLPGRAVLGGQNLAVTQGSQRARKATELIEFLTSRESERCLLDAGFAATRTSVYEKQVRCVTDRGRPSASPTSEGDDDQGRLSQKERDHYRRNILLPALERAVHRPRTPLYGAFTQTFMAELGPLFGSGRPTDEALARRLHAALGKALPR